MFTPPNAAYEYADEAFRDCDFDDQRVTRRVVRSIARLTERPDDPVSTVFTRRSERVAFGRLLHNPRMVPAVLHEALAHDAFDHAKGQPYVVAAHDTVFYTLAEHVEGTGAVSTHNPAQGVLVHNAILSGPTGAFLGVVAWDAWTRAPRRPRRRACRKRKIGRTGHLRIAMRYERQRAKWRRRLRRRESWKWITSLGVVRAAASYEGAPRVRHVLDREGDDWRVVREARSHEDELIVRARTDRGVEESGGKLWAHLEAQEIASIEDMDVQATPKRAARTALVAISFAPVTLRWRAHHHARARAPMRVWAVWIREVNAPRGVEALEWMLLCTFPVETVAEAREVRANYAARWGIEPFHQVTKSGLHVESRWVDDVAGFERLVALTLPAAAWLLRLQHAARATPKAPATTVLSEAEVSSLKNMALHQGIATRWRQWTVSHVVQVIAIAGGYNPQRASPPGWRVLWRGWKRFRDFYDGWSAREHRSSKG